MAERTLRIVQKIDGRFAGDVSITRTEAIEKMAKAMIKRYNSERTLTKWEKEWDKKHPKEAYKYFYIDAEKALNALLEGK